MVSYKLVFNRKNKLNSEGKALVQIEVYQKNCPRRYFSTDVRITPQEWNPKSREIKNNTQANRQIMQRLMELKNFESYFPATHGRVFALADFDLMLNLTVEEAAPKQTFSAYMRAEIDADKPSIAAVTYQRRGRVLNRLNLHHGGPVAFGDLTFAFINRFDQAKRGRFKLDDNTVEAEHKILKRYISRAVKSGLLSHNPYDQFKIRGKAVDKAILTDEEIKRIELLPLDEEQIQLAIYRDAFLLAYYTMLRVSDLITLTPKHVVKTAEGLLIEKVQCKTKQRVRIPLGTLHGGKAQELLLKYWPTVDGKRFISRTAQHMNRRLKDVLKLAEITKINIGFHSARHSGITCLVRRGVPLAVVQSLAGHADIKMTMTYVHLAGSDVEQALANVIKW
ncbi:site-specific integrase [Fibrella forsythiae]|uniref:Site-specific integrase n=1 Tax=Fibrella forsythiae TaxID=2817061 RepID=A0ABS3JQB9_9BACT|nr:site-specific integrase [Fibrella forsythiae]MBO0951586.1 site-specific integrase [Fibrella forsythiae]